MCLAMAFVHDHTLNTSKLLSHSIKGMSIGYFHTQKGYRVYLPNHWWHLLWVNLLFLFLHDILHFIIFFSNALSHYILLGYLSLTIDPPPRSTIINPPLMHLLHFPLQCPLLLHYWCSLYWVLRSIKFLKFWSKHQMQRNSLNQIFKHWGTKNRWSYHLIRMRKHSYQVSFKEFLKLFKCLASSSIHTVSWWLDLLFKALHWERKIRNERILTRLAWAP